MPAASTAVPAERGPQGGAAPAVTPKAGMAPAAIALGAAVAAAAASAKRKTSAGRSTKQCQTTLHAVPDAADAFHQFQEWMANGGLEAFQHQLAQLPHVPFDLVPPAHAEDAVAQVADAAKAAPEVELDPNVKYLYGADGKVLLDPYGNKPLVDDWWNGFVGIQRDAIVFIDSKLRELGVPGAFGWSIALYTLFLKVATYPLQQGSLRTTSMMQLMQPKVKEITERYKDDQETQSRLLAQLYGSLDVNPLGGCLPTLLQLPIFYSLFGVWRRLYIEKFPYYGESWLWVPSLAQPNPDFQWKLDWIVDFVDGAPRMGWEEYGAYFIFPAILVGTSIYQTQQAQAARPKTANEQEEQNLVLQLLPLLSVYLIGTLSLELPQAVSVYYTTNTVLTAAQTAFVKYTLRQEIPGYDEFEKTGKFPDGAFEYLVLANSPAPKNFHEACVRGDKAWVKKMLEDDESIDINGWDEKQIAPLGYAVACGHLEVTTDLLSRGAKVDIKDGMDNTLLHYAAGYGHLDTLKVLLEEGKDVWPNDEWAEMRNKKNQTIYDAARVNQKGAVQDFLRNRLGMPAETEVVEEPEVIKTTTGSQAATGGEDANAEARAALIAFAGGAQAASAGGVGQAAAGVQATSPPVATDVAPANPAAAAAPAFSANGMPPPPTDAQAAEALKKAVATLRDNPEAVEKARAMMGKLPPNLLSALSGGKLSEEDAKNAMAKMQSMSTKDMISAAESAATKMESAGETVPAVVESTPPKASARAVD